MCSGGLVPFTWDVGEGTGGKLALTRLRLGCDREAKRTCRNSPHPNPPTPPSGREDGVQSETGLGRGPQGPPSPIPTPAVLPADVQAPGSSRSEVGGECRQGRNQEAEPPWPALCQATHSLLEAHRASRLATAPRPTPASEEGTGIHSLCTDKETEAQTTAGTEPRPALLTPAPSRHL